MRKKSQSRKRTSTVRRQRDPIPWKYCILTLVCGLFLVSGFFWAARAHFSSMDYGMKNAKLRKQIEQLKSETRRLKLAREIALSPAEIKKAAKKLGLTTMTARNIEVVGKRKTENNETDRKSLVKKERVKPKKDVEKKDLKADKKKAQIIAKKPKTKDKQKSEQKADNFRKDGVSRNQTARR